MSKFKINLTKIVSYVGVGIFAIAALFVFGVAKADAAITIQGDAYNPSYNLYLFGYTAAQANPCNGVAEGGTLLFSLSNLYDAPNKITPDVNYNDNDDFSTTFDTADGNTFIYLCNGVGGGLGNLLTNSTINTVNGNTYSVDISSVYGTSLDAALNGKNVVVCDELDGTKLNGTARQVAGQTYEQYYLKYSAAGHITLDDVYVLLTDSDACTFDSNVVSGRRADITSATSYNSYGVQIPFSPDTKVDGDAHANLSVAKMELKDASDNSIGLTEAVAVADGAGGSKDYTMYYQEPAASDMTLTITSTANGTTVVSGIDSTAFTAGYDFINDVTDNGAAGVPDDIAAIKTTMDVGADSVVFTTTRHDTYFYDLYTDIGGAAQTILFQKPAGTTVFQKNVDSSAEGDDTIDVGKVAGSAHADMSTGGNDLFEVFNDDACSSEVSSTNAFGAAGAYEVYFEDTGADFWIKTTQDNGEATAYDSCGNHIALTNQAATQNLNRKITAVLPIAQIGASTADTVIIDFNQDVAWTTATDVWTRDIEAGTAILYTTSASADGNDDIVVADDNNADPTDGFGTVLLRRAKNFTLLDATLNVGGVEGDTHADLNDEGGDSVEIYSDAACTTTAVSSATVAPAAASDPDYGIFFEPTGGTTNYYAKFVDASGATACVKFGGATGGDTTLSPLYKLTTTKPNGNDTTGDQINSIAIDNDKDGAWDSYANNADATATNVAYSVSDADSNVYAYYGADVSGTLVLLKTSGVNLSADETVGIAAISGDLDDDFIAATATGAVVDDAAGLIAVYTDWDNNTAPTGLSNSHYVVNEALNDTYAVYLDVTAGAIGVGGADIKVKDQNNLVSWTMNQDDSGTTIAAGERVDIDLATKVSGDTPVGTDHINLVDSGAANTHLAAGVVSGDGLYAIYTIAHDPGAGDTIQGIAQEPKDPTANNNAELIRNLTAVATPLADATYNVASFSGTNHADLNAGTVVVYSDAACSTAVSSETANPVGGAWTQYFQGDNGTTYYTKIATAAGGFETCRVTGDALAGNTQTVAAIDFSRKVSGTVKDTSVAGTDVLSAAAIVTGAANNYFSNTVDGGATTYQMYVDSTLAGAGDTVRFYSAAAAGGTKLLERTKDLSADTVVNVSAAQGNAHASIQEANGVNAVCADHSASNTTCATKYSSEPQTPGATYEIFFEQQAGTTYYLEVLDNDTVNYYSWDVFTNAGAGAYTNVELDGKLDGTITEAFNVAIRVPDVTIKMYTNGGDPETNQIALTYSYTGTTAPSGGTYRMYGNSGDTLDAQYAKGAYITQSAVNVPNLDDTVDIAFVSGVKVIVKERVSDNVVTDATVSIYTCSGATASTCTVLATTCTQPSGDCTRTGDNSTGNGASGEYYFSGIPTGSYIQIRVAKTGYANLVDPDPVEADNPTYQISDTVVQPAGLLVGYTYYLENPAPEGNLELIGGAGTYESAGLLYADDGQQVTVRFDTGEAGQTVTADLSGLGGIGTQALTDTDGVYTYTQTIDAATGIYTITVTASDGVNTDVKSVNMRVDDTAPVDPVSAGDPGDTSTSTSVTWSWTAGSDASSGLKEYNVQLDDTAACASPIWTKTTTSQSYTVSGLTNGTTYYMCVQSVDNVGNTGTYVDLDEDGILVDTTPNGGPSYQIIGVESNGNGKKVNGVTYANVGDVVTVSFQASEALAGDPAVAIGGEAMVKVSGEGGLYVFSRTLDGEETTTAIITIGGQTDILGNEDSDATDLGANFEFDFTAPTVVVAAPGTQNSKSFLINATAEANSECRMDENNISFDAMNRFGLSETAAGVFAGTYIVPTDGAKTIYVICRDYAGNEGTDDTGAFTVATTEPSVTTIDPTISGGWETGANVTAALMTDVNATCKYDDDEAATFASMDNTFDGAGTTTHSKTIANVDGINSYYVLCQSADGVTMTSPITISWKGDINNPSTPTRALPANGGTYVTGSVMMWGGSTDGEGSGVASYTLQIDNDVAFGSPEINIVVNGTAYALSGANITALNGGTNYWRVQAVDNAARASGYEAGNRTIVIDKTAPTVEDFSPEDEDTGVDTSAEIYLLFSEEMDVSTFVDENVDLYASDGDGGWVAVDIKEVYGTPYFTEAGVKKSELVVEPEDLFEYNTEYTLVVTNDITDLSGNPFAGLAQGAYTFTTEAFNTGNLSIDNVKINPDKSYAINNHDWDDGWEWEISLTVPTDETRIRLMFSDFTGSTGSIPATGDNIRYYSADSSNGHTTEGTAINVATVATYPGTYLIFNAGSDQQPSMDGYQVVVKVQVRVPASATGGSYAGQFKVEATAIPAP